MQDDPSVSVNMGVLAVLWGGFLLLAFLALMRVTRST